MIWKTQLPWKKKLSIMFMFSGGFIEMAFGIMRAVSIMTVSFQHHHICLHPSVNVLEERPERSQKK